MKRKIVLLLALLVTVFCFAGDAWAKVADPLGKREALSIFTQRDGTPKAGEPYTTNGAWTFGDEVRFTGEVDFDDLIHGDAISAATCEDHTSYQNVTFVIHPITVDGVPYNSFLDPDDCSGCNRGAQMLLFDDLSNCPDYEFFGPGVAGTCIFGNNCCSSQATGDTFLGVSPAFALQSENFVKGKDISVYTAMNATADRYTLYSWDDASLGFNFVMDNLVPAGTTVINKIEKIYKWNPITCDWDYNPTATVYDCTGTCTSQGTYAPIYTNNGSTWDVWTDVECDGAGAECGNALFSGAMESTGADYYTDPSYFWKINELGEGWIEELDVDSLDVQTSVTTVDLPLEPVTATTGLLLMRANNSTSPITSTPALIALTIAGVFKLSPGLIIIISQALSAAFSRSPK